MVHGPLTRVGAGSSRAASCLHREDSCPGDLRDSRRALWTDMHVCVEKWEVSGVARGCGLGMD